MNKAIILSLCLSLAFPVSAMAQEKQKSTPEPLTTQIVSADDPLLSGADLGEPTQEYKGTRDFWHEDVVSESFAYVGEKLKPIADKADSVLKEFQKGVEEQRKAFFNDHSRQGSTHISTDNRPIAEPSDGTAKSITDQSQRSTSAEVH
jgi:hypothetical protein